MSEQLKLFDDGLPEPKPDPLYSLILEELNTDKAYSGTEAHLVAAAIAEKIRLKHMYCACGGGCGCGHK